MSPLMFSPLDSDRFKLRIFRCDADPRDAKALCSELFVHECDIAFVRVPAGDTCVPSAITRLGLPLIHADTLVVYEADLTQQHRDTLRNPDLHFRHATPGDSKVIAKLVEDTFDGYRSHYIANPMLDGVKVAEGYREWCRGFVERPDGVLWLAERHGSVVGFAACSESEAAGIGEGVLYGVSPEHSGGGIYSDLIRYTRNQFASRGFRVMRVSTQVWNLAVQKVWARVGFSISSVRDTYHVNAMLACGSLEYDEPLLFDAQRVEAFAQLSGDVNPIHLDLNAAEAAGFSERIVHGALCTAEVSRVLGTVAPGRGTVLSQLAQTFLRPVYVGRAYRLTVRVSDSGAHGARRKVVARIDDSSGPCVVSRADVVVRS